MALQLTFNYPINRSRNRTLPFSILGSPQRSSVPRLMSSGDSAAISWKGEASHDPELRYVLELATDTELYEVHRILFGPSYFSPLLKSVINGGDAGDSVMIEEDLEERNFFISALESRFLFLAADARATLRGWRPTYRNVLLSVRKKLGVPCSRRLPTEDLEVEIFLHLLQEYSSEESGISTGLWENSKVNNNENSLELGVNSWKAQSLPVVKGGVLELFTMILKGSGVFTLTNIYQLLAKKFSKKLFLEAASYQIKREALKKSGQLAAINLESRAALLAAKQGFAGAASRYVGLKSMMGLLGPMLWGTFLADVVIQMLGTDYARIMRAIYAFAQVNLLLNFYGFHNPSMASPVCFSPLWISLCHVVDMNLCSVIFMWQNFTIEFNCLEELNPKHVISLNSTVRSVSLARISYQMKMAKEIAVLSASLDPSAGI